MQAPPGGTPTFIEWLIDALTELPQAAAVHVKVTSLMPLVGQSAVLRLSLPLPVYPDQRTS